MTEPPVSTTCKLCDGPRAGYTVTLGGPPRDPLFVPPRVDLDLFMLDDRFPNVDTTWGDVLTYHRGPLVDLDGAPVVEYYHDSEMAMIARAFPGSGRWTKPNPHRFRGWRRDERAFGPALHLVATVPDGRYFSLMVPQYGDSFDGQQEAYSWDELEHRLAHELLPGCVVPGCEKKAPIVLRARVCGYFAGRLWEQNDEIRLCPMHCADVRMVRPGSDDDLPEWLAADAHQPSWAAGPCILPMAEQLDNGQPGLRLGGFW